MGPTHAVSAALRLLIMGITAAELSAEPPQSQSLTTADPSDKGRNTSKTDDKTKGQQLQSAQSGMKRLKSIHEVKQASREALKKIAPNCVAALGGARFLRRALAFRPEAGEPSVWTRFGETQRDGMTNAITDRVRFGRNFWTLDRDEQLRTVAHEMVHVGTRLADEAVLGVLKDRFGAGIIRKGHVSADEVIDDFCIGK